MAIDIVSLVLVIKIELLYLETRLLSLLFAMMTKSPEENLSTIFS